MKGLGCDRKEAEEIYAYDQEVEHDSTVGVLSPDKEVIARKMTHTGTRARKEDSAKKPFVPKLEARKRKPNATKEGLVAEIAEFLKENSGFEIKGLQTPSPTQKVSFKVGDLWYTWTLTEHRKAVAWIDYGKEG